MEMHVNVKFPVKHWDKKNNLDICKCKCINENVKLSVKNWDTKNMRICKCKCKSQWDVKFLVKHWGKKKI